MEKRRIEIVGNHTDDSIVIGSHGDTKVRIAGTFSISGIIHAPRNTVTLSIKGKGKVSFRGICSRLIIKKMEGECTLDLSELSCKEMKCISLKDQAVVIAGRARAIREACLHDNAVLYLTEKPLIINSFTAGNSKITSQFALAEQD